MWTVVGLHLLASALRFATTCFLVHRKAAPLMVMGLLFVGAELWILGSIATAPQLLSTGSFDFATTYAPFACIYLQLWARLVWGLGNFIAALVIWVDEVRHIVSPKTFGERRLKLAAISSFAMCLAASVATAQPHSDSCTNISIGMRVWLSIMCALLCSVWVIKIFQMRAVNIKFFHNQLHALAIISIPCVWSLVVPNSTETMTVIQWVLLEMSCAAILPVLFRHGLNVQVNAAAEALSIQSHDLEPWEQLKANTLLCNRFHHFVKGHVSFDMDGMLFSKADMLNIIKCIRSGCDSVPVLGPVYAMILPGLKVNKTACTEAGQFLMKKYTNMLFLHFVQSAEYQQYSSSITNTVYNGQAIRETGVDQQALPRSLDEEKVVFDIEDP